MHLLRSLVGAALLFAGSTAGFGQNLLLNGSFENGFNGTSAFALTDPIYSVPGATLEGWLLSFGSIESVRTGYAGFWTASDGDYSVDLNGMSQGGIQQAFGTTPGQRYDVTFDLWGNPAWGTAFTTAVSIDGTSVGDFASTSLAWSAHSFSFVATGTTTVLAFASTNTGSGGPALDRVAVTAIPEPSTIAAFAGVFALAAAAVRRRRAR